MGTIEWRQRDSARPVGFKVQRRPTRAVSTSSPEEALVPPSDESGALLPGTGEQVRRPTQAPWRPGAPCVEGAGKQDGGHCLRGRRRAQPPCAARQRVGWREHGPGLGTLRRGPPEAGPPSTRRPQHAGPASGNGRRQRSERPHAPRRPRGDGRPLLPLGPGLTSRGLTARLPCLPGLPASRVKLASPKALPTRGTLTSVTPS